MSNEVKKNEIFIPTIILNIIIILICLYLFILFVKNKTFHSWPCINIITFSLIVMLDNILRLLPFNNHNGNITTEENIQAFLLVFFDKLLVSTLTMQSIIIYLGVFFIDYYLVHEKIIFIITFLIGFIISIILSTIIFVNGEIEEFAIYCYVEENYLNKIIDTSLNGIYILINIFCNLCSLLYVSSKKKEAEKGQIEDLNYKHTFYRIIALSILNILTFLEILLIVHGVFKGETADILYLITCLSIAIYNGFNEVVIKETLKIFCKNTYEEKFEKVKSLKLLGEGYNDDNNDNDDNDEDIKKQRTDSF